MKRTCKPWKDWENKVMVNLYPGSTNDQLARLIGRSAASIKSRAAIMGLKKSKAYVERINLETRFVKGGKSWNKGKKHPASGRSPETQFKKGTRPHNWSPIGTESTIKGDYLTRKVTDTGVSSKDFVPVHHLVWIEHTGQQIPKDHALIFKDGNKRNFDIDNLELITRADLMRRNSIMALPPEISAQARIIGAFNRKLRRIERERNSREPTENT